MFHEKIGDWAYSFTTKKKKIYVEEIIEIIVQEIEERIFKQK